MNLIILPFLGCTLILFLAGNAALVIGFTSKDVLLQNARNTQAAAFFIATVAWLAVTTFVAFAFNLLNLR